MRANVLLPALLLVLMPSASEAGIIFVFDNDTTTLGAALDGVASGSLTQSGLQITATASSGVFNATGSNFGINQPASNDDTDGFDFTQTGGPGVAEGLTISFNQNVTLDNIGVSSFGADGISITVGGVLVTNVSSTGVTSLGSFAVASGTSIVITTTAGTYGNGWSLDSFEATVAAVPEPASLSLLGLLTGCLACRRRRRSEAPRG